MDRSKKVKAWCDDILKSEHRSFYFRGPAASGKTYCLKMMGKELQENGYKDIFYISSATLLDKVITYIDILDFLSKRTEPDKPIIILVDEAQTCPSADVFQRATRECHDLKLIACGVSSLTTASPCLGADPHESSEMLLNTPEEKKSLYESFLELRNEREITDLSKQELIDLIDWIIQFAGGQVFPVLMMINHMLTPEVFNSYKDYQRYLQSSEFYGSPINQDIVKRAYAKAKDLRPHFLEILEKGELTGTNKLKKYGYWDETANWFTSDHLLTYITNNSLTTAPENVNQTLTSQFQAKDLIECIILAGLKGMTESDFQESPSNKQKMENAVGFCWGYKIQNALPWLFIAPQTRAEKSTPKKQAPTIDFTFNGIMDVAVELSKNHWDIPTKLQKIGPDGVYKEWYGRSAILNFQLNPKPRLNRNDLVYHYVKSENVLYRGTTPIYIGAVTSLQTPRYSKSGKVNEDLLKRTYTLKNNLAKFTPDTVRKRKYEEIREPKQIDNEAVHDKSLAEEEENLELEEERNIKGEFVCFYFL